MHQMMPCPREVGDRTLNQLALTFGTLLSSQSTDAHPPQSLDRLGGNPVNITRSGSQCQLPGPIRPVHRHWRAEGQILADMACGGCRSPAPWDRSGATWRTVRTRFRQCQTDCVNRFFGALTQGKPPGGRPPSATDQSATRWAWQGWKHSNSRQGHWGC
jgi:hypothetical protein